MELTDRNLWDVWYPESALAGVLDGGNVVVNIGQVRGAWKKQLEREVRAGRLAKWKGYWHPVPGAPFGLGPLKTCYGHPDIAARFAAMGLQLNDMGRSR